MTMLRLIGEDYCDKDYGAVILCGFNPFGGDNTVKAVSSYRSTKDPDLVLPGQCPLIIISGKGEEEGESSEMKTLTHVICGDYSLNAPLAVFLKEKIIAANQKLNLVN
ncbi:hypothetical protein [Lactobacillus delbrueckii]|uniref:hypothetical protein n=1 Tax=Lactobacillus delbrueckii TaxID=1584 RepID=UPI0022E309CB|nr:hypothetical protein [Lactobacillus delbrueckii]